MADALPNALAVIVAHDGEEREVVVDRELDVDTGDALTLRFRALEAPNATYTISGLPPSARAAPAEGGVDVRWAPVAEDAGAHELVFEARDGEASARRSLAVRVEHAGQVFFAPGVSASVYVPDASARLGAFVGAGAELLLYGFTQRGHPWFPSHGRFYFNLEILASTQPRVEPLAQGALGFDISLEQSPRRRFLLPFLGAEIGASFGARAFGWGAPLAGVILYATDRFRASVRGSYLLAMTNDQELRGPRVGASLDYGWW